MNGRFARAVLATVTFGLLAASCAAASAEPGVEAKVPGPRVAAAQQAAPLAECDRPDIVLGSPLLSVASGVDRAMAQRASGAIGVRGPADIALLTTVTIGTDPRRAATPADALVDRRGVAIVSRPAWVLVFRNQTVRAPSGGVFVPGAAPSSPRPVSVLASVVDAYTGDFLRGWGCAFGN